MAHRAVFLGRWWVCGPSLLYSSPSHIFMSTGPEADGVRMPQRAAGGQGVWLELCTRKDRELGGGSGRAGHSPPCECAPCARLSLPGL